jgi:serine/threonine protein phosphatase PrpC
VSSLIDEDEIASILQLESPEETAWAMVEAANRAGGLDNITALIVDAEETIEPSAEL